MNACRDFDADIGRYLDGPTDAALSARVEAHLAGCDACRAWVADVRQLSSAARALGPVDPPEHVWLEVAGQIRATSGEVAPLVPARRRALVQWVGLAAALLAVTTMVYFIGNRPVDVPATDTSRPTATAPPGTVAAVNDELNLAVEHYERAIANLQAMTAQGSTSLEPALAAVLDAESQAIDRAITESRTAVASDPENESARVSLFDALRRKVSVLQATVSLITEMNQGDAAGAARAAETLGREL
jgi:predicted anti-sigma-YlaC factor YlaD